MLQISVLWPEHVWDGFVLMALLEDYDSQDLELKHILGVPHGGTQKNQFDEAIHNQNLFMSQSGQPEWAHYCSKCCRVKEGQNREPSGAHYFNQHTPILMLGILEMTQVIVTDGITIGHPCCGVAHCSTPLASNKDRFCPDHQDQGNICCVISCCNHIDPGFLTCSEPNHQELDRQCQLGNKGFFQLCDQLAQQKVTHPDNSFNTKAQDDIINELQLPSAAEDPACQEKDADGKKRIHAHFGCWQSHNKQIFVCPCGIIVA